MLTKRYIPINLRLPENLIKETDQLAQLEGSTRSEFFRTALRSYIEKRRKIQDVYSFVEAAGKKAGINSQEDLDQVLEEYKQEKQQRQ